MDLNRGCGQGDFTYEDIISANWLLVWQEF